MEELKIGCARPLAAESEEKSEAALEKKEEKREGRNMVMVGKKAPDFIAPAYYKGKFVQVKLSDYLGKWVLLCFYPGDFTFV